MWTKKSKTITQSKCRPLSPLLHSMWEWIKTQHWVSILALWGKVCTSCQICFPVSLSFPVLEVIRPSEALNGDAAPRLINAAVTYSVLRLLRPLYSHYESVYICVFIRLLAWIKALQEPYPTVIGHTVRLLAGGDAVMVCGIAEAPPFSHEGLIFTLDWKLIFTASASTSTRCAVRYKVAQIEKYPGRC